MFDFMLDWQSWLVGGIAFIATLLGIFVSLALCHFVLNSWSGEAQCLFVLIVTCIFLLYGFFVGFKVGKHVDPEYFSNVAPCFSCGTIILKTDEYCTECGYEQIPTCDECGNELKESDKFCAYCGTQAKQ